MATYTYLRVQADGADGHSGDDLAFRKAIQDALARSFGVSAAGSYLDVLRLRTSDDENGSAAGPRVVEDAVIRVARDDAQRIKAALASASTRLSVVDEAQFLPALLASEPDPIPEQLILNRPRSAEVLIRSETCTKTCGK